MKQRITVMTAGHLSTCPRMLKAADAFHEAGYEVQMISTNHVAWATETDRAVRSQRDWAWTCVDYDRSTQGGAYLRSGVRFKLFKRLASLIGAERMPLWAAARAYSRIHSELCSAALGTPRPALVYGGTTGALAAVATVAARWKVPFALDLEDYHSAEQEPGPEAELAHALARRIQSVILPKACFRTAGSDGIARAYESDYQLPIHPIHNTFPLPRTPPDLQGDHGGQLRLYWFSQTIGAGRGLEESVLGLGVSGVSAELRLRGRPAPGFWDYLRNLAQQKAPQVKLVQLEPSPPDQMTQCAAGHDIGLAIELPGVFNRRICTTNKCFTYMLAGLAIVFSDTDGHRVLQDELGPAAGFCDPAKIETIAQVFKYWAEDRHALAEAKRASWKAAERRWHWEHPLERGRLLELAAAQLN